ncbi:hypothetical protein BD779DRAFT_1494038, partial [Infundibulicybe gibba]
MEVSHPNGPGQTDGPGSLDNFKRAVLRPPPHKFTVEVLPPAKHGSSYSYGMHIFPIITSGDRSSVSSRSSFSEYQVWRRWEDCLWFQQTLELEYSRMAREKRRRLAQGKGVKKDGFYKQDQASSWESLPPGPDPNSVARDIHDHVPRLTNKGTFFKPSQSTIDQRQREFKAAIEALLQDDVPALVQELRENRLITDFFGFWRRDKELAEKQGLARAVRVVHLYFSASNPNLQITSTRRPQVPQAGPHPQASGLQQLHLSRPSSAATSITQMPPSPTEASIRTSHYQPLLLTREAAVIFGYNPYQPSSPKSGSFSEDGPCKDDIDSTHLSRSRNRNSDRHSRHRNFQIFVSPPRSLQELSSVDETTETLVDPRSPVERPIRESWQSAASASTILHGLNVGLPEKTAATSHRASVATFMTDCSADAVIPRSPGRSPLRQAFSADSRLSMPVSVSESDTWPDFEDVDDEVDSSIYDLFPLPAFITPEASADSRPETPLGHIESHGPGPANTLAVSSPQSPLSFSFSAFSDISTLSSATNNVSIKAVHNNSIIVLRVARDATFEEVRRRLYNKFVGQEGVPLSHSFTVAFMHPQPAVPQSVRTRSRSNSVSSVAERTEMSFITSQPEWDH